MTAGYSGKSLAQKLGIKPNISVIALNTPLNYLELLGELPAGVNISPDLAPNALLIHFFAVNYTTLEANFPALKAALDPKGMMWISWLKATAKTKTDLNENLIREMGLKLGLVDVKVAAVDAAWSGIKFVYRLKDR